MANPHADLQALTVRRTASSPNGSGMIRPPRRWVSRVLLPVLLLGGFAALVAWAAWDYILPGKPVKVIPVVVRTGVTETSGAILFKQSGYIEPRPTPIEVTALAEGVVEELPVVPGQRVNAGDVIAKLIDADARLALDDAQEDLAERKAKIRSATADVAEAEARFQAADYSAKVFARLKGQSESEERYKQAAAERDAAKAKIEQAKGRLEEAEARVRQGEVVVRTAALRLERMTVRTPVAGVIMSLHVTPGRMVGARSLSRMAETGGLGQKPPSPESLVSLYNPDLLQVRVPVKYKDFHLVRPGQPALVEVEEVLPGTRLLGTVLYDTRETNVQLNSVYVKVGLMEYPTIPLPAPAGAFPELLSYAGRRVGARHSLGWQDKLRPEMFANVHFIAPPSASKEPPSEVVRIVVPRKLIQGEGDDAKVWIYDQAAGRASLRPVVLAESAKNSKDEFVEVAQGLQPTDKLITTGRESLQPGDRVRIIGEGE